MVLNKRKKFYGVTLLEVMLVLAIAAMIIVMSVRYYQTATTKAQVNQARQIIQAIGSAADEAALATSNYAGASTLVPDLMPGAVMPNAPWGGSIKIKSAKNGNTYTVTISSMPYTVCRLIRLELVQNSKTKSSISSCNQTSKAPTDFSYTYNRAN